MEKHCGKYPVVFLNLKDCKGDTWAKMYNRLWGSVCNMVRRHQDEIPDDIAQRAFIGVNYLSDKAPDNELDYIVESSLQWLTQCLHTKYGVPVIVLIDEYDLPLNHAFQKGFYEEASEFLSLFYSKALKDNSALEKACLVGIVEMRGAGILSGLNNFRSYSVADERYSSHFGFTRTEITQVFKGDEEKVNTVMKWYNGYQIGLNLMVNPFSFVCCVREKKLEPYWVKTSAEYFINADMKDDVRTALTKLVSIVADVDPVTVTPLKTQVDYTLKGWDPNSFLHFFVLSGYLSYSAKVDENGKRYGEVRIPNRELKEHWEELVVPLTKDLIVPKSELLRRALTSDPLNLQALKDVMQDMILEASYHDFVREQDYHNFFFGALLIGLHDGCNVKVVSNRESGHGRFDICVEFHAKRVIIIEFKKSAFDTDLAEGAKRALDQNIRQQYRHTFTCPVELIGVSFCKKLMSELAHETR